MGQRVTSLLPPEVIQPGTDKTFLTPGQLMALVLLWGSNEGNGVRMPQRIKVEGVHGPGVLISEADLESLLTRGYVEKIVQIDGRGRTQSRWKVSNLGRIRLQDPVFLFR